MAQTKLRIHQMDSYSELRILVNHPMENGRNRDHNDQLIPAHYIKSLKVFCNQTLLGKLDMSGSMSKNPFLVLQLDNLNSGDLIQITWEDNLGQSDSADQVIP